MDDVLNSRFTSSYLAFHCAALLKNATNEMTLLTCHSCHHRVLNVKGWEDFKAKREIPKINYWIATLKGFYIFNVIDEGRIEAFRNMSRHRLHVDVGSRACLHHDAHILEHNISWRRILEMLLHKCKA